ncbi:hypothetical protein [Paenibacillus sp. Leaf72]|uniref:hypothetical protein n=1 Tax=Paenibacillus sp. Leaf72 TaxID=1736234 RepID=UPI0007008CC4|nr:hypothetical protein [Paenibacillus sp. Leaf72]KQN96877.1 hypothetical protein ASF12_22675 [Paenibacillus sp. Leaf72]
MFKIFSVKKGSNAEKAVISLVNIGRNYIPSFENELGIADFCLDLEVVTDSVLNKNLFLIVGGFANIVAYQNSDLHEMTEEEFKEKISTAFAVNGAGTNEFLKRMGYKIFDSNNNGNVNLVRIEKVS